MASLQIGACLSDAVTLYKKNFWTHVVVSLLVMAVGSVSAGLLAGPMLVGYIRMLDKEHNGEAVEIGDVFRGFDDFVPAFVASLICMLVLWVGFLLCFIPGLLIMALPVIALFLVARGESDGVEAFKQAWRIVTKNLLASCLCALLLGLVGSLGGLLCGIGMIFTLPIALIGQYYMARQLVGDAGDDSEALASF